MTLFLVTILYTVNGKADSLEFDRIAATGAEAVDIVLGQFGKMVPNAHICEVGYARY